MPDIQMIAERARRLKVAQELADRSAASFYAEGQWFRQTVEGNKIAEREAADLAAKFLEVANG